MSACCLAVGMHTAAEEAAEAPACFPLPPALPLLAFDSNGVAWLKSRADATSTTSGHTEDASTTSPLPPPPPPLAPGGDIDAPDHACGLTRMTLPCEGCMPGTACSRADVRAGGRARNHVW
eukprot:363965-Chlamydomonas_euryale.AAC.20